VARALGLSESAIKTDIHPPQQASLGLPFVFVELNTREALASIATDVSAFREGVKRYPTSLDFAIFAYVRGGQNISSRMSRAHERHDFRASRESDGGSVFGLIRLQRRHHARGLKLQKKTVHEV